MTTLVTQLPARRTDLVIRPIGEGGRYVVKIPHTNDYFHLGEEEHFLLTQLDGERNADAVCVAFETKFGEPLSEEDLDGFIEMARKQGLLEKGRGDTGTRGWGEADEEMLSPPHPVSPSPTPKQSILYWRKSILDPDRFFTWLEPKVRFFWTRAFLVFSAGCIFLGMLLLWTGRAEVVSSFNSALRWETLLLVWLTTLAVGMLHESAHGLTCKHYGGEVREIGFLLMFFMPCFYCNVSDAWLFRERSKRLWVTFAGGYFELFVWALAVFVWRVTMPDTLINYLAFIVLTLSGIDSLFNFNPLIKLDGYYLLSDLMEIPNLRQRSFDHTMGRLRRLLWGAPRPEPEPRGRFLLSFGLVSWLYSLSFLGLMLFAMSRYLSARWGPAATVAVAVLGVMTMRGLFKGISAGEASTMILTRHKRTAGWLLGTGALAAVLCFVKIDERVSGPFEVRAIDRAELRAPVAGFLEEVCYEQGDRVSPGQPVLHMAIPDLSSRLTQKRAEQREAQAKLRLLEVGPRPGEVLAQKQRAKRAAAWQNLARQDLDREQQALRQELDGLEQKITQCRAELDAAREAFSRAEELRGKRALTDAQYDESRKRHRVAKAQLQQARAEKAAHHATGTLKAEAELARRARELAEAQATLELLEAGTRPEEIEAERARLARLQEEIDYLEQLQEKLAVFSPVPGLMITPRLTEQIGNYFEKGETICLIEDPHHLQAEIALAEQDVTRVAATHPVTLKARALPFATLRAQVDRIAPAADPGEAQSTLTVYVQLEGSPAALRPGMTGHARITTGHRPIGRILLDRTLRFLRTEFWW